MADKKIEGYIVESRKSGSEEWLKTNCFTAREALSEVEAALEEGAVYIKVSAMFRVGISDDVTA